MKNLSPALISRIDALDGCRGRWIVDCRAIEGNYSYALRSVGDHYPTLTGRYWTVERPDDAPYKLGSVEDAALYCSHTSWKAKLLFCSDWINDDCGWPGGYDAHSIIRSNAKVFREEYANELERADGDAYGISLDVRYITDAMIETIRALEDYPLISDDDHSELEYELQQEEYESNYRSEWRDAIRGALEEYAPDDAAMHWEDDIVERIPDSTIDESFNNAMEDANVYWEEQGDHHFSYGWYVDIKRMSETLTAATLSDITGLTLLPASQAWRREPYPWPGAEPSPLIPPLPVER